MFTWAYNVSGGRPLILELKAKDTETLTEGDLLNLESGEADLAATNDTTMIGVLVAAAEPTSYVAGSPGKISAVDSTTVIKAIVNPDAVYAVVDANARLMGAQLDIAGATGAMTIAADSNHDVVNVKGSGANQDTLVMIAPGEHFLNPA